MNKVKFRRFKVVLASLIFISSASFSQIDNIDFLKGGTTDAVKIIGAYFAPFANAFGAGLNGGWYNTAKPHKLGGFDLTISFNIGLIPSSAGTFNVDELGLTSLTGTGLAPTISGSKKMARPTLTKVVNVPPEVTVASFQLAPGTGWKIIPVPTAQIGVGLPLGTELKIRYMPKLPIKDADISLWGVGLLHSIMQYIKGAKLLPVDVSVFGGYTKLMTNVPLSLQPGVNQAFTTYNASTSFNDQKMSASVGAWNVSVLASVKVPVITIYGGLGYSKTVTDIRLKGNYPLPLPDPSVSLVDGVYKDAGVVSNFPAITIKNFSGLRANLGVRAKFSVVTFHVDYTRSQYNVISTGLGISFR